LCTSRRSTDLCYRLTFFMNFYLSPDTFGKLLESLSVKVKEYYQNEPPLFLGVGISGVEIVGRLPYLLDYTNPEISVCDVHREKGNIEIIKFPNNIKDKKILICYIRVDTGKTLEILYNHAMSLGAKEVASLSVVVRNGAAVLPNFYSFVIGDNDNTFFLLEGYPPDLPPPYPQVMRLPNGMLRHLKESDMDKEWFECGDSRIDKLSPAEVWSALQCKSLHKVQAEVIRRKIK
jgi:hypoxanthine-guanine phosphoribosyltransferase